jgi:hypothetical protein
MASVLVATVGDKKLYYVLDSKDTSNDGIVEDADGTNHPVPFFSYIGKTTGIRPLLSSEFHKFLWNEPSEKDKTKWMEIFIQKIDEPDKMMMDGVAVQDSTGKPRKKKTKTDLKAKSFIDDNRVTNSRGVEFSTKMIRSDIKMSTRDRNN